MRVHLDFPPHFLIFLLSLSSLLVISPVLADDSPSSQVDPLSNLSNIRAVRPHHHHHRQAIQARRRALGLGEHVGLTGPLLTIPNDPSTREEEEEGRLEESKPLPETRFSLSETCGRDSVAGALECSSLRGENLFTGILIAVTIMLFGTLSLGFFLYRRIQIEAEEMKVLDANARAFTSCYWSSSSSSSSSSHAHAHAHA